MALLATAAVFLHDEPVAANLGALEAQTVTVDARIVATGEWEATFPDITIAPPPAPPRARVVARVRTYGSAPALTGPVLEVAAQAVGVPYVAGGSSLSGFDCSGFTSWVYRQLGVSLPRTVGGQRNVGTVTGSPVPGDIIWTSGHVGLYVAPGWQIDAPRPGKSVQVRPIWQTNPLYIHVWG